MKTPREAFDAYAGLPAGELPDDPWSRAQVRAQRAPHDDVTPPEILMMEGVAFLATSRYGDEDWRDGSDTVDACVATLLENLMRFCTEHRLDLGAVALRVPWREEIPDEIAEAKRRAEAAWRAWQAAQQDLAHLQEAALRAEARPNLTDVVADTGPRPYMIFRPAFADVGPMHSGPCSDECSCARRKP